MARPDLRSLIGAQVQRTAEQGATILIGGTEQTGSGNFFYPTVLAGVRPGMASFEEEVFGPVASLIEAEHLNEAVHLANESKFGLSSALWTRDYKLAKEVARHLEVGGVFINGYSASDPRVPIGGVKQSGYGRELSHLGIREFLNAQVVWRDRQ
jgi:succinate-semialdehyde dehydrogenase